MTVYVLMQENRTHFKVGFTEQMTADERRRACQTGNPVGLYIAHINQNFDVISEGVIKDKLDKWSTGYGEWFFATDKAMRLLERLLGLKGMYFGKSVYSDNESTLMAIFAPGFYKSKFYKEEISKCLNKKNDLTMPPDPIVQTLSQIYQEKIDDRNLTGPSSPLPSSSASPSDASEPHGEP